MDYILAYDLGTGGTKTTLFRSDSEIVSSAFTSVSTSYPRENFHEQRPDDWWRSVVTSTQQILSRTGIDPSGIACLAVSGHSLVCVPLSAEGAVLTEYTPIWSDGRGQSQAREFFTKIDEKEWYLTTGNGFPAPNYSIFKMMWIRENMPDVYRETSLFLGSKDYVNYRLTGVAGTDFSYASGSGFYDLLAWKYNEDFVRASGIDREKLPETGPSSRVIGKLTRQAAAELGLREGTPVVAGGVDNACMALGAGCIDEGSAYTSLGSSSWIAVCAHQPVLNEKKRSFVFAHCIQGMYASATAIFSAGNSLRWVKEQLFRDLELNAAATGADVYDLMTALAAKSPVGSRKLIFNPSLAGGSPIEKSPNIRGGFIGLRLGHTREDLLRATLEGICLNLRMSLDILRELTQVGNEMLIVGGGSKSRFWRQLFADVYGMNVVKTNVGQDAGSLGAMACAAVGIGLWNDFGPVKKAHKRKTVCEPDRVNSAAYEKLLPVFAEIAGMQADAGDLLQALQL